ncbi:hypothetical protein BJ944DRAFT_197913 [Cunninghamella echinulata]|nr:hypothetical protein BJ944DRAFT_197913 [Cunninghamella echinulata]
MGDVHGRKREKTTDEILKARREKDAIKIKEYNELVEQCRRKVNEKSFDKETLLLTTQILRMNPDFYSVWNWRRLVLKNGILLHKISTKTATIANTDSTEEVSTSTEETTAIPTTITDENDNDDIENKNQEVYKQELDLFMQLIRINPKSYWLWNHRVWCLENMPKPDWNGELYLVNKMLTLDSRNFHGWSYRRYVARQLCNSTPDVNTILNKEYDFTTEKIKQSFSNYSAWHQRSQLLPRIVSSMTEKEKNQIAKNEFDLIKPAIYTDPDDQSAWLYYWWLIGKAPSPVSILGAFKWENDSNVVIAFNDAVRFSAFPKVYDQHQQTIQGNWYGISSSSSTPSISGCSLWSFIPEINKKQQPIIIEMESNSVYPVSSAMTIEQNTLWKQNVTVITAHPDILTKLTSAHKFSPRLIQQYKDSIITDSNAWYTLDIIDIIKEEITAVRDLIDIEPDSKWALQTLAHFLQQLKLRLLSRDGQINISDELDDESIEIYERLITLDKYRANRYKDTRDQLVNAKKLKQLYQNDGNEFSALLYLIEQIIE